MLIQISHPHRLASPAEAEALLGAHGVHTVSVEGIQTSDPEWIAQVIAMAEPDPEASISWRGGSLEDAWPHLEALTLGGAFESLHISSAMANLSIRPALHARFRCRVPDIGLVPFERLLGTPITRTQTAVKHPESAGRSIGRVQLIVYRGEPDEIELETTSIATAYAAFCLMPDREARSASVTGLTDAGKPALASLLEITASDVDARLVLALPAARALTELFAGDALAWHTPGISIQFPEIEIRSYVTTEQARPSWLRDIDQLLDKAGLTDRPPTDRTPSDRSNALPRGLGSSAAVASVSPSPMPVLEGALANWRSTGAPEHAAVFEVEARRALEGWTPPVTDSARTFQRAWLRVVENLVSRGWALDTLVDQLPGADAGQRADALAKRIEVLVRYGGPDPRFVQAIARVESAADVAPVRRLASALRRLEAAAQLDTDVPITRKLPPATAEIEALWRDVQADPDDEGSLAVLADALQLAGDPRGELIALQILGDAGDDLARAARRKQLIANCGAAWLGPLARVTAAASFERGVLRRLQLSGEYTPDPSSWDALIADPMLATVTDLLPGLVNGEVYLRFITSAAMRSLARVEAGPLIQRAAMAPLFPPFPLPPSITHLAFPESSAPYIARVLPSLGLLRSIAVPESDFGVLATNDWFPQLAAVTLGGMAVRRGLARWAELPRSMTLTLVPSTQLPPCSTDFPWDFGITLLRDGPATIARVSGQWLLLPVDVLSALPPDVLRVEVDHASAAQVDRIRRAIGRPSLEVVQRPVPRVTAVFTPTPR